MRDFASVEGFDEKLEGVCRSGRCLGDLHFSFTVVVMVLQGQGVREDAGFFVVAWRRVVGV
jgi:hypothetical protein